MYKGKLSCIVIFWTLLSLFYRNVDAGPMKRLSRMAREVYPEIDPENDGNQAQVCIVGDLVYGTDEPVPAEQPCLKCRCQPPGVQCETIQCVKKPGCKAIHKSNKCCPDYQCECEHNGKFYANGERLETPPGGECKVCYCRGGEVQCAEVSCYIRKDCEGKRVPGKCCPKYDHCPPIDPVPGRPLYSTEIAFSSFDRESLEPWPITGVSSNATENIFTPTSNDIQDENKILDTSDYEGTTASYKAIEADDLQKETEFLPRITIQEIIPERKEIPITAPPRTEIEPQGTLLIEEAEEFLNHSNELVVTDSDTDSSEIAEVFQQPPPILKIGDTLLFLKKGEFVPQKDISTPNSVITIIGAEGLQRGFEDSGEIHEVNIENISKENNESKNRNESFEESIHSDNLDLVKDKIDLNSSEDTELNTAFSTHILSLVKRKNKPSVTTELSSSTSTSTTESQILSSTTEVNVLPETSTLSSTATQESVSEAILNNIEVNDTVRATLDTTHSLTVEETKNATENVPGTETENNTETKEVNPVHTSTKIYDPILDHNPAYPPIPDIMSPNIDDTSQRFDIDNTERDHVADNVTTLPSLRILPEVLEIRSNKTVPQNVTNSEWLKSNHETLINYEAALPDELLNQPAPSDIEESTETITDTNTTTRNTSVSEALPTTEVTESENVSTDLSALTTEEDKEIENTVTVIIDSSVKTEEDARSVETIGETDEDSGESTTPKNSHASIISSENASIEEKKLDSSEAEDMVSVSQSNPPNDNSGEETTPSALNNSEMIDKEWTNNAKNTANNPNSKDVEIIDSSTIQKKKPAIERAIETTTEELLPRPDKIVLPSKIISKREITSEDRQIFKELEKELNDTLTERSITSEEEKKEADAVFKELLEDTNTPKVKTVESQNKEADVLQRVFKSLTLFSQDKKSDSGVLGTIVNLFNPQRYSKK